MEYAFFGSALCMVPAAFVSPRPLALAVPLRLEYFSGWTALALFGALAVPIVWLGARSLNGLGKARRRVAIGARLAVIALLILILGGIRWQRRHTDLEVMVVRDISQSTQLVRDYPRVAPEQSLQSALDGFLVAASTDPLAHKPPGDRIGQVSFAADAGIDAMPYTRLALDARAIRTIGSGTDVATAIQLALATFGRDAMKRLVLIWDGNATAGDTAAAVNAAIAQKIPIDVVPLRYDVHNEVMVERFVAPTWKRQGEDFSIEVVLRSTNAVPVTGRLSVYHQNRPMDLDPQTEGMQSSKLVTLAPGINVQRIKVPGQSGAGVHQFRAQFDAQNVAATVHEPGAPPAQGDTLIQNNSATAFTFVRGKGKVLYVDNVPDGRGELLRDALGREGISVDDRRDGADAFPTDIVTLQNYDAVILANVPRAALTEDQQRMLAAYVHDTGGGLVMIGGEDAFGAGGWQGSILEQILPVSMDIPAQRQIAKGALVLVMHACEFADGNYWGAQCAIKAAEALSSQDEVGVISFGAGGSRWDFPLQQRGDGAKVLAAIKAMNMGDMPSFDDSLNVALNGGGGNGGLLASDARQKHIIIISDGDPAAPANNLLQQAIDGNITISTVTVFPHPGFISGTMQKLADATKGRAYGPINNNPGQLPQIFIKEAALVRRSLIHEKAEGIALKLPPSASDIVKGLPALPPVYGLVLTSRKNNPQVEMPIIASPAGDPVLAEWQTGLGRAVVFTSDATNKWGADWVGSPWFGKFWAQVVRSVSRPPMSGDFDIQTAVDGDRGKVVVEALNKDSSYANFLSISGQVMGPDMVPHDVRLVQTGPGTYEARFDTPEPGNYVLVLSYRGQDGSSGVLLSGLAMNDSPELRHLQSQNALLEEIARRSGGRVLDRLDPAAAGFFRRDGLHQTASPLPVWDLLIPFLLALFLIDVATRRIAWDLAAIGAAVVKQIRGFTGAGKVRTRQSIDALQRVRAEAQAPPPPPTAAQAPPAPPADPGSRFNAPGVAGEIADVLGGATDKPVGPPSAKSDPPPAPPTDPGAHTGGLLEAKRRARRRMDERDGKEGR